MSLLGTGTTITFASGFFAQILSVEGPSVTRAAIPIPHMGTTGGIPKLAGKVYDPGRLEVELGFQAEVTPPFLGAIETVTLTVPSAGTGGDSTWVAQGFLSEFTPSIPFEERQTARAVVELSGSIAITA